MKRVMGAITTSLLCLTLVSAQEPGPANPETETDNYRTPAIAYPSSDFNWYRHASTAQEGALRGAGAYVQSLGQANYYSSLAAINFQEAYRRGLENMVYRAEAYYARRDVWHGYQERHRRKPLEPEGYARLAAERSPGRLTEAVFDPDTGKIQWIYPLDAALFAPHREAIEELFAERTPSDSGRNSRNYEKIRTEVAAMKNLLEGGEQGLRTLKLIHAMRFLESVEYEARFAVGAKETR